MLRFGMRTLLALTLVITLASCGSSGGTATVDDTAPGADTATTADGAAADGTSGADVAADTTQPIPANFRIAFTYKGRVPNDTMGQSDMWLVRGDGSELQSLTGFIQADDSDLTCQHGCFVDDNLSWIAVATGPRVDASGFDFQIGRFNEDLVVRMSKAAPLEDIIDLHFAGHYMYFSSLIPGGGSSEQFEIWRVDLLDTGERQRLLVFPPNELVEDSIYKGRFDVSPSGEEIVLLRPTIRSQQVFVWREGRLDELDFICGGTISGGECVGTGSEYSDIDPVAISPDGRYIAAFFVAGQQLRLRLYDLDTPGLTATQDIAEVPSGLVYKQEICNYRAPWQPAFVGGDPAFSPDGQTLYFFGWADCGAQKLDTDVYALSVARIQDATPIEEADLINVTNTTRTGGPDQIEISSFAFSPDGQAVVFAGTPSFTDNDQPIPPGSSRHLNDAEIWVQRSDGGAPRQITNDKKWEAITPLGLPLQSGSAAQ